MDFNSQDEEAVTYLDSSHFEKGLINQGGTRKGPFVSLTTAFHKYLIYADTEDLTDR